MEVSGKIKVVGAVQEISSSFRKREVVITTEEQYPQTIMIEFTQDRIDLLNGFNVNDPVRISINLRGREWVSPQGETRYFNTIQGWRIERMGDSNPGIPQDPYSQPQPGYQQNQAPQHSGNNNPFPTASGSTQEDPDDLPF